MTSPLQAASPMALDQLFAGIVDAPPITVTDLSLNARRVADGGVFLACQGQSRHGLEFADAALERNVAAIAYEPVQGIDLPTDTALLAVPKLRQHLGQLARRFFADPSRSMELIGITGTNGKTTVAWLLAGAFAALGRVTGYIGTLGSGLDLSRLASGRLTTPDIIELTRLLSGLQAGGASACVLEASSHALDQDRLAGLNVPVAVFTNLSRDHLDYHGSMSAYQRAKLRLFERPEVRSRIIAVDDAAGRSIAQQFPDAWQVSLDSKLDTQERAVSVLNVDVSSAGIVATMAIAGGEVTLQSPLLGTFNVQNLAIALATLVASGVSVDDASRALGTVAPPPGRMQPVTGSATAPLVVVDFAHTAAALELALTTLRAHGRGQLWCVFGCGGDRDQGKRADMAVAAATHADVVVVTSDNPRSESPDAIVDDIVRAIPAGTDWHRETDRRAAIEWAIAAADSDDIVLVAGRGHETVQVMGSAHIALDDRLVAAEALERRP